ncbi:hypothetical protein [Candidatus Viridilinea mediisalina]|uniref:Cell division protein FtsL n=1 Tax=Candidatus Viridilinea mediisalina TaxID=2024553 RepID=A0A2A6RPC0_9CHLR|nr:hypothetical protein [Candidatus Viridilinea mediisalina]PDW04897.1 hypothetical protein CJ255_01460 [Candidatus Viridilinea mediisalina]
MAVNTQRMSPIAGARARRLELPHYLRLEGSRYLLGLVAILSLMSLIVLLQTGAVATRGYAIARLEAEKTQLLRERTILLERQARAQSLDRVRYQAEQLGLRPVQPDQVRYLSLPQVQSPPGMMAANAPVWRGGLHNE